MKSDGNSSGLEVTVPIELVEVIAADIKAMDERVEEVEALVEHWRLDEVPEHDRIAPLFTVAIRGLHSFGMSRGELLEFVGELYDACQPVEGSHCTVIPTATAKARVS